MAMMVLSQEGIADDALPVAALAAQMRLPDLWDAVPSQVDRLRQRLRAAISMVETRSGRLLIARDVILGGEAPGGNCVPVPLLPVSDHLGAEIGGVAVTTLRVENGLSGPVIVLARSVSGGVRITVRVRAGYETWAEVPDGLAQAVLVLAEALDMGTLDAVEGTARALIGPYRLRRIGGRG